MRICLSIFLTALAGCAAARPAADPDTFPLSLAGDNTEVRFELDKATPKPPGDAEGFLADQELCYLSIDNVTIECFPFGSLLMLGPDDAVELVFDNPLDGLHPAARDPGADTLLQTLSIVSLIAGSIDRVPDSLADYIDNDNSQNPAVARALAQRLLEPGETKLRGFSAAATFTVAVRLTDTGKETLLDALADRQNGGVQLVRSRHGRPAHVSSAKLKGISIPPRS